ncbi:MAG: cytosolic protein, partial [Deltaproteobacteria bacterium]|nr:cytosolic protein [Deltaproteobacteria bacterium]
MTEQSRYIKNLDQEALVRLAMDMLQRLVLHHGMWFNEIKHQMGLEKAFEMYSRASEKSLGIQINKLSRLFDFGVCDGLPEPLLEMPRETLLKLLDTLAANWLVNDGVWFQAVEFSSGMNDAKRCNDSCWAQFSPVEAWSIKKILNLPANPGIEGLKQALNLRLYAHLNTQSTIDEGPDSIVFQMNECRV